MFITNKANEEQRQALINIYSGQAKGDAPFALFAATFKYFLEPQFVDIKINLNGKKSSFSVADVIDIQTEGFRKSCNWRRARYKDTTTKRVGLETCELAKTKIMRITTQSLNFDHSGQNAFYAVVEYKGP